MPAGFINVVQCTTGQELVMATTESRFCISTVHVHGMAYLSLMLRAFISQEGHF